MKIWSLVKASIENDLIDLAHYLFFFINIRNIPNEVITERKIGKVARKVGKFGEN